MLAQSPLDIVTLDSAAYIHLIPNVTLTSVITQIATVPSIATSSPMTEAGRYNQWELYFDLHTFRDLAENEAIDGLSTYMSVNGLMSCMVQSAS